MEEKSLSESGKYCEQGVSKEILLLILFNYVPY
jgi:hypothetical protein